jgi:hypothetical protein
MTHDDDTSSDERPTTRTPAADAGLPLVTITEPLGIPAVAAPKAQTLEDEATPHAPHRSKAHEVLSAIWAGTMPFKFLPGQSDDNPTRHTPIRAVHVPAPRVAPPLLAPAIAKPAQAPVLDRVRRKASAQLQHRVSLEQAMIIIAATLLVAVAVFLAVGPARRTVDAETRAVGSAQPASVQEDRAPMPVDVASTSVDAPSTGKAAPVPTTASAAPRSEPRRRAGGARPIRQQAAIPSRREE